jgi:hypothetical protein
MRTSSDVVHCGDEDAPDCSEALGRAEIRVPMRLRPVILSPFCHVSIMKQATELYQEEGGDVRFQRISWLLT